MAFSTEIHINYHSTNEGKVNLKENLKKKENTFIFSSPLGFLFLLTGQHKQSKISHRPQEITPSDQAKTP